MLEGRFTIGVLRDKDMKDQVYIELEDVKSSLRVIRIKISPEDLTKALTGRANQHVEFQHNFDNRIGFKMEVKTETLPLEDDTLIQKLEEEKLDGWEYDEDCLTNHHRRFNKHGKSFVTVTFRRWVADEQNKT